MNDINLKASLWLLFTSERFFEAAAAECEDLMHWFGSLAIARNVSNFGRNNQVYDTFKLRAQEFRRGAELARHDDFRLVWSAARSIKGDARGFLEQPLNSWMTKTEFDEFENVRLNRLMTYAELIEQSLSNAMTGADGYFSPDPECPERADDDDGFPGDAITEAYQYYLESFVGLAVPKLPEALQDYIVDTSVVCTTGEEVPLTGVWYPNDKLPRVGLTFAIKGLRMQPAYQVTEDPNLLSHETMLEEDIKTIAVPAKWHPVVLKTIQKNEQHELWSKAGEPCPKSGIWQSTEPGTPDRAYIAGETMASLNSAYGITVWRWIRDR